LVHNPLEDDRLEYSTSNPKVSPSPLVGSKCDTTFQDTSAFKPSEFTAENVSRKSGIKIDYTQILKNL
jgi:hypothetical protein